MSNIQLVLRFFQMLVIICYTSCKENKHLYLWIFVEFAPNGIFLSSLFNNYPLVLEQRLTYGYTMDKAFPASIDTMNVNYKESQGLCTFYCTFFFGLISELFVSSKSDFGEQADSFALLLDQ